MWVEKLAPSFLATSPALTPPHTDALSLLLPLHCPVGRYTWHNVLAKCYGESMPGVQEGHLGGGISPALSNQGGFPGKEDISVGLEENHHLLPKQYSLLSSSCMFFLLDWVSLPYLHFLQCIVLSRLSQVPLPHSWVISGCLLLKRPPSFEPDGILYITSHVSLSCLTLLYYSYLILLSQYPQLSSVFDYYSFPRIELNETVLMFSELIILPLCPPSEAQKPLRVDLIEGGGLMNSVSI